jgi:hypothetical protein
MPTALPAASAFTGAGVTEGGFKTAQTAQREFLAGLFGADGTQATALATLGALLNGVSAKAAAYTVVAADRGKLIDCTGTWTLTLTAAATLGAGFAFGIKNSGAGTITVDPNGAELIDGAATAAFGPGESGFVLADGMVFKTVAKAAALTSAAIVAALTYTPAVNTHNHSGVYVGVDHGYNAVGSFLFAFKAVGISVGTTCAGNLVFPADSHDTISAAMTGTWRCLGTITGSGGSTLFQRIA